MAAHYDTYDYPAYWKGRDYEHRAEMEAIKSFLQIIPKIDSILEIGAGYGRLIPSYSFRGKKILVSDPSAKLLSIAQNKFRQRKFKFLHSRLENLPRSLKKDSFDLIICVRVIHHIENSDKFFEIINNLLKNRGFLILEFANKKHFKASISQIFKGNFTFPLDIFPSDKRSSKSIKNRSIPFLNYHPDVFKEKLTEFGFNIIECRSVSNIRSSKIKNLIPAETLLNLEKWLQIPLSYINFGPSIFVLAQKRI